MKVWTCEDFEGHFPVGVAAVVAANTAQEAAQLLSTALSERGLRQDVAPGQMKEFEVTAGAIVVLCDGNY